MNDYAEQKNVAKDCLRFRLGGVYISGDATPKGLGLKHGDIAIIRCHLVKKSD